MEFTITKWLIKCGIRNVLSEPILDEPVSVKRILLSDGGVCMVLMSCFWRSTACGDNIRQSLCLLWCLAVIMDYLKVIEFFSNSTTVGYNVID